MYSVMERNLETQTYRIHDAVSEQEKVVHRNLLASFLPVSETSEISELATSIPETVRETGTCLDAGSDSNSPVGEDQAPLSDPEPVDLEMRNIEWVTQLSNSLVSEVYITDVTTMTPDLQQASI